MWKPEINLILFLRNQPPIYEARSLIGIWSLLIRLDCLACTHTHMYTAFSCLCPSVLRLQILITTLGILCGGGGADGGGDEIKLSF